jgi:5'-nucleotidase (lipoprotein e(P4) family)
MRAGARTALLILMVTCLSACAFQPRSEQVTEAADDNALLWYRTAAERKAIYLQTFAAARAHVNAFAAARPSGDWGVVLDVDETVLDNSEHQLQQTRQGKSFDPKAWEAWVRSHRAIATPGARDFLQSVRELGGRIVFVTNRSEATCDDTRVNLRNEALPFDEVLCAPPGNFDKNPRFARVAQGSGSLPPLNVVAYIGDNIGDFPNLTQTSELPEDLFGTRYFVLPNPMYGSWQRY